MQLTSGFGGGDSGGFLGEDITGIPAFVQFHDRDSGLRFAVEQGPDDRGGAAVFGQQRGVDVQAAVFRERQHGRGEQLAVSGHDEDGGRQLTEPAQQLLIFSQFVGLPDRETVPQRLLFDRRRPDLESSSLGPVGLADDSQHFDERGTDQGLERAASQFAGAQEN